MLVIIFIIFIVLYKIQRKLCSQPISFKKKIVIPISWCIITLIFIFNIFNTINNHSNQLIAYTNNSNNSNTVTLTAETDNNSSYLVTNNSKILATLSISKNKISFFNIIELIILFNIPTALFAFFIITGKISYKKTKELHL
ncbi:MAG: hypothetical protein H2184_07490 [Candidatus Galacturonibacter soehngenii]|nr:hypothetical protein [Candidatus Galacturonibacter soehngenii]